MCWMRMRSAPPGCSGTPLTEIGPVPARDRSYSAPRSVHFQLEIGPVPRRDRSTSAVLGHEVGDTRLMGGWPSQAVWGRV